MADESRRPEDNAEQARLNDQLKGLNRELARNAQQLESQAQARGRKTDERLAREERIVRERKRPARGAVPEESAAESERIAKATRDRADAESRIAQARRQADLRTASTVGARPRLALPPGRGYQLGPAETYADVIRYNQYGGISGGLGGPPPPPRPPTTFAPPPDDGDFRERIGATQRATNETQGFAAVQEDANRKVRAARAALDDEAQALRRAAVGYGAANQGLRRHGALTTEFIQAAARGQTTFEELRFQVGSTIGKFAGWTAAATAVFGVLGAVQALGRGAIDSSAGVNQLDRVIDHVNGRAAQAGFRDLSRQFNLPIGQVADAQYQLGKFFGDQNEALKASPALLAAVKVGELSVADASRFLVATTNAYGLAAGDLLPLLDQFNSLQNNMGVSIRDTAAGVAKASGQFRAAGGDLRQLVAIVGAGTRVTGLSGEQFGTLLQRSAGLIQRPKNQAALKALGIDPEQDITTIYNQAFALARKLAPKQRTELAEALSTPQLAPRLTALLGRPDIYRRALRLTAPDIAKDSAFNELDKQLNSVQERIKRLGTDLEQLGSTLSSSGAFDVPGAFLVGLDKTLHLSTGILSVWSEVPTPIAHTATSLLEVLAIMRLLQRFNVGDAIVGRAPELGRLLQQSPERRARGVVGRGLEDEQKFYRDEIERTRRSAAAARAQVLVAQNRLATLPTGAKDIEAVEERNAQQIAVNSARARAVELENQDTVLTAELDKSIARTNRFKEDVIRRRRVSATQFAEGEGVFFVNDLNRPTTSPVTSGRPALGQGLYTQRLQELRAGSGELSRAARVGTAAAAGATTAWTVASRNIGGLASGVGSLATRLYGAVGPLGALAIASFVVPEAYQAISDAGKQAAKTLEDIDAAASRAYSPQELQQRIDELNKQSQKGPTFAERVLGLFDPVDQALRGPLGSSGSGLARNRQTQAEAARRALVDRQLRQAIAVQHGTPVPDQSIAQIDNQREDDLNAYKRGTITETELHRRLQKRIEEYKESIAAQNGDRKNTRKAVEDTRRLMAEQGHGKSLADLFRGLTQQQVGTAIQTYLGLGADDDFAKNLRIARAGLKVLEQKIGKDRSPEALQQLAQARKQIADAVEQHYQKLESYYDSRTDLLQSQTTNPVTQARILASRLAGKVERVRRLYDRGIVSIDVLNQAITNENRALQQIAAARLQDFQAEQQLGDARFGASHVGDQGAVLQHAVGDARRQIAYLRGLAHRPYGAMRDAQRALFEARTAYAEYLQQQAQEMSQAQTEYDLAGVDDPVRRAELQLRGDRRDLQFAKTPADRLQARAKIRQDRFDVRQTRQQDSFDTIEFEAQMGKLDRDAEIARLRILEKTIRGNRDLKRQVQLRIHELRKELEDSNDVELNVGNIRLPTLYDVRRLAQQGTDNRPVVIHSPIAVHGVSDPERAADIVTARISQVVKGSLNAKARSALP